MGLFGVFRRRRRNGSKPAGGAEGTAPESAQPRLGAPWRGGRPLRLRHRLDAAGAPLLAQDFVDAARDISGAELDFSQASLEWVDGLLETFREPGSNATAETVLTAGCYTGEVLVRGHGWRWRETSEAERRMCSFPIGLESPSGTNFADPLGKAFKRVDEGPQDSLRYFVAVMLASEARETRG